MLLWVAIDLHKPQPNPSDGDPNPKFCDKCPKQNIILQKCVKMANADSDDELFVPPICRQVFGRI